MPKSYSQVAARIRVPSNFLLSAIYLIFAQPTRELLVAGAAVAFAGLLLRATITGYLEKNQQLATSRLYPYTRNPLYFRSPL
ncbi:MAG: isoprenylcysteine carboxylmethyltransferase family protein, partial [Acidobacteria bacterium]|nr:isoprenylcysteine carboxylmethyltransferase family protein [Acidobacteriota bacterium]